MPLRVVIEPAGTTLYRLYIWDGDQEIGEYERTRAADLERKKAEIASAAGYLLDLFAKRGRFIVRWDGVAREKVVRQPDRRHPQGALAEPVSAEPLACRVSRVGLVPSGRTRLDETSRLARRRAYPAQPPGR